MPPTLVWIPKTSSVAEINRHFQKCLWNDRDSCSTLNTFKNAPIKSRPNGIYGPHTSYNIKTNEYKNKPIDTPATTRAMRRLYDELATTESTCPICMDDIKIGQSVTTLPCKHKYHYPCIRIWIQKVFAVHTVDTTYHLEVYKDNRTIKRMYHSRACNNINLMHQIYLKLKEVFDNQSCMGGVRTDHMLHKIVNKHEMIFDSGQDFTDEQLKALIDVVRTLPLTALHLRGHQDPMRDKQFLQLLPVLTSHEHLQELCITEEELSLDTCKRIAKEMTHLKTLGIANPFPDPNERQAFLQALADMTNLHTWTYPTTISTIMILTF